VDRDETPGEVQALQWTGDNAGALHSWVKGRVKFPIPGYATGKKGTATIWVAEDENWSTIEPGDWVIRDSKGFHPRKPTLTGTRTA